jgi:hypothetical protein
MNKNFSFSRSIAIFLLFVVLFITCTKEYSYEGGKSGGTAVYTLSGAGATCTGAVVNGKYYNDVALGSGNTIQLQVNVTTTGTFTLSTNTVNGIYFSASGSFTNTGLQSIILSGTGTPVADGNFSFTTPTVSGCSFMVTVDKLIAAYTLAGAPGDCTKPVLNGYYISGKDLAATNTVDLTVNVTSVGAYTLKTDTLDGISFSASGIFTTTGIQTVSLAGTGTPLAARYLVFTPQLAGSACTFPLTVANPEPVATYVLESGFGNPNPCTYTVSGNYVANSQLTTANYVSVRVYVTVVGNYTIATNTVNGMMFSHSGIFTATGNKDVILEGSGKPAAAGTYLFTPEIIGPHPLGGETCAFNVTVN